MGETRDRRVAETAAPEGDLAERFAEALHSAMWGINVVQGMKSPLGVHAHTTDREEFEAQREFIRRCLRYVEGVAGLVPAPVAAPTAVEPEGCGSHG